MSDPKKTTWRVKGIAIKHDDTLYAEGDEIELSEDESEPLARWLESPAPKNPAVELSEDEAKTLECGLESPAPKKSADKKEPKS